MRRSISLAILVLILLSVEAQSLSTQPQRNVAHAWTTNAAIESANLDASSFYGVTGVGLIDSVSLSNTFWGDAVWTNVAAILDGSNFFEIGVARTVSLYIYTQTYYWTDVNDDYGTTSTWGSPNNNYHTFTVQYKSGTTWDAYLGSTLEKEIKFTRMSNASQVLSSLESQSTSLPDSVGTEVNHWQNLEYRDSSGNWNLWYLISIGYVYGYTFNNVYYSAPYDYDYYCYVIGS